MSIYALLSSSVKNIQDMDERRTVKLGETYQRFAEAEKRVIPIISKCLDGMVSAAKAVDARRVSLDRKKKWLSLKNQPIKSAFPFICPFLIGFLYRCGVI